MKNMLQRWLDTFILVFRSPLTRTDALMDFLDEPATWKQLRFLSRCGYRPDHRLTKHEASRLISNFRGEPESEVKSVESVAAPTANAYQFRLCVENKLEAVAGAGKEGPPNDLESAKIQRQEFWLSTCRGSTCHGTTTIQAASKQVLELYRKHGCLFCEPTHKQVQDILDALDSAMPLWDRDHPELFYQALKLNFPELERHH